MPNTTIYDRSGLAPLWSAQTRRQFERMARAAEPSRPQLRSITDFSAAGAGHMECACDIAERNGLPIRYDPEGYEYVDMADARF